MEIERLGGLAMSGMLCHVETRTRLERPITSTFFSSPTAICKVHSSVGIVPSACWPWVASGVQQGL